MKPNEFKKLVKAVLKEAVDGGKDDETSLNQANVIANSIWGDVKNVEFRGLSPSKTTHFTVNLKSGKPEHLAKKPNRRWYFGKDGEWQEYSPERIGESDSNIETLGDNFTPAEKLVLVKVINTFTTGGHRQPDVKNIGQFGKEWIVSLLAKAEKLLKSKPEYAKELATLMKIKQKLVPTKLEEESSTGGVAGYSTPFAFTKNKKGSPKGIAAAEKYGKVVGESPRV